MTPTNELGGLFALPDNNDRSTATARIFTPRQRRLIDYLSRGGKYSVIDIANALYIGDPRSDIRDLRKMGVKVLDMWVPTANGRGKYKRFWIERSVL